MTFSTQTKMYFPIPLMLDLDIGFFSMNMSRYGRTEIGLKDHYISAYPGAISEAPASLIQ
jgi:hypothetical protein